MLLRVLVCLCLCVCVRARMHVCLQGLQYNHSSKIEDHCIISEFEE